MKSSTLVGRPVLSLLCSLVQASYETNAKTHGNRASLQLIMHGGHQVAHSVLL